PILAWTCPRKQVPAYAEAWAMAPLPGSVQVAAVRSTPSSLGCGHSARYNAFMSDKFCDRVWRSGLFLVLGIVLLGCGDDLASQCEDVDETAEGTRCDPDGPRYCEYGPEDPCRDLFNESGECSCDVDSNGYFVWFCMAKGCIVDAQ